MPVSNTKRAIRIAGCSGSVTDRRVSLARLAASDQVDAIIGDWMSEYNMTTRGGDKVEATQEAWEPTFVEALEPALATLASRGVKLVCNAGASDTQKLAFKVVEMLESKGLSLKVAWIEGDEVFSTLSRLGKTSNFESLTVKGQTLKSWGYEPIYAQAYLGSFGIVEALKQDADIVLCGRVADPSPVIGLSAWWHSWTRDHLQELAGSLVAGHIAECSNYVTGGNWSGFKSLRGQWSSLGYPIVEIEHDGTFFVTKEATEQGVVNCQTISSQLLYEIQGPIYYNSDTTAILTDIQLEQVGKDRVRVTGVGFQPPPATTKVGVTAKGGYQAELAYYLCGLDIADKAQMVEDQCRSALDLSSFSKLKFMVTGSSAPDPETQDAATVELRIFAQAREASALESGKFLRPLTDQIMQSYPGATFGTDTRKALPKPFFEYFVTLMPQNELKHKAHILGGSSVDIAPPTNVATHVHEQPSYETKDPVSLDTFGPTTKAPLGYIVHARSGDKGSDANVGFYVRHPDEWDWLRSLLTVDKIKSLLGKDYKQGERVDRFEMRNLCAVHFLLKNHLDRGVASTSTYDYLGKNVAEYLRAKHVDIPNKFLERGRI